MYSSKERSDVEKICYEEPHILKVLGVIKNNFDKYFEKFVDGADKQKKYQSIISKAINEFQSDRQYYEEILNSEDLEEYEDDPTSFKSDVLKNRCPIIRKTIQNKKAKELDLYRANFKMADPSGLLGVVKNIAEFGAQLKSQYDSTTYEDAKNFNDLNMETLDSDDCTAYGVIGGGIKTHLLYKVYPEIFPNRSRNALWALWYLSGKGTFDCKTDSEFLMIDTKKSVTNQNYFYPCRLFAWYAFSIYKLLKDKATAYGVKIDENYRYVVVDEFLNSVVNQHEKEISYLKSQIKDGGLGFA